MLRPWMSSVICWSAPRTRSRTTREGAARGRAFPDLDPAALRAALGGPLPAGRMSASRVIDDLVAAAAPGLVATTGPRYFGFVIGGALDSATAADVLTTGWDQPAYNAVSAPGRRRCRGGQRAWLKQLLGLPASASFGFVTGAQAANTVGLAAARHHVLTARRPRRRARRPHRRAARRVIASVERHATIDRSLRLLGFGSRDWSRRSRPTATARSTSDRLRAGTRSGAARTDDRRACSPAT